MHGPDRSELPDEIYKIWKSMESVDEEDLDDAQVYLRLMQEAVVGVVSGGAGSMYKRRTAKRPWLDLDLYRRCVAHGLKPLARLFTLPAARMGQVMKDGGLDVPPQPPNDEALGSGSSLREARRGRIDVRLERVLRACGPWLRWSSLVNHASVGSCAICTRGEDVRSGRTARCLLGATFSSNPRRRERRLTSSIAFTAFSTSRRSLSLKCWKRRNLLA